MQRDSSGLQVGGSGFAADSGLFFDATQGLAQAAQHKHLLLLFFSQDIGHHYGGYSSAILMPWLVALLADFQVTIIGIGDPFFLDTRLAY